MASQCAAKHDVQTPLSTHVLLADPAVRSATLPLEERAKQGVLGLVPPSVESYTQQAKRVMAQLNGLERPYDQYQLLCEVAATSQELLHRVLLDNLEQLMPIVYTPTVGEGCTNFHLVYRHPPALYFSAFHNRGHFREIVMNWPEAKDAKIMVLTDGGRILGLGDLGLNGVGISMGKIALYVAGGGFHPVNSIPAVIDAGTNNEHLRSHELYQGERAPRLPEPELLEAVEELCAAVAEVAPHCLVQFEDFETDSAVAILEKLHDRYLCFNDDIQGTAAVVVAGVLCAFKMQGKPLADARIVMYGAGASSTGVAHLLARALELEGSLSPEQAKQAIYMVDSKGLLTDTRPDVDSLPPHKRPFLREGDKQLKELPDIIRHARANILIGLSGHGPSFGEDVVKAMLEHEDRPLIMPLSNPTDKSEISAEDAYRFSGGAAIFAAGSPYKPVKMGNKTLVPMQANNVLVFPGLGFGAVATAAKHVDDDLLLAAAKALQDCVTCKEFEEGRIYADIKTLREVSARVAAAVAENVLSRGLSRLPKEQQPAKDADLAGWIRAKMWTPPC